MVTIVAGSFHQQPPEMAVAGLGNASLTLFLAGGLLAGHHTLKGHELLCGFETAQVPDLAH